VSNEVNNAGLGLLLFWHDELRFVGMRVHLPEGEPVVLGRGQGPIGETALANPRVSRRHLEVVRMGDRVALTELGSQNGTCLNGATLRGPRVSAFDGDVISVGPALFMVRRLRRDSSPPRAGNLVGLGDEMARVVAAVDRAAGVWEPVLVVGERGSGRGRVVRAVHLASGRDGRLVRVSCREASDDELVRRLVSEPSGFGDVTMPAGALRVASGGTLRVDDIERAGPNVLRLLASVTERGVYRPEGAAAEVRCDVRLVVVADASEVLPPGMSPGLRRRLEQGTITVPSLASRVEDIPGIALELLERASGGPGVTLSRELAFQLVRYDWPNNAPELVSVVERLVREQPTTSVLLPPTWLDEMVRRADGRRRVPHRPWEA
jgi:two-component system nitrogen regulation response regulator GlnG